VVARTETVPFDGGVNSSADMVTLVVTVALGGTNMVNGLTDTLNKDESGKLDKAELKVTFPAKPFMLVRLRLVVRDEPCCTITDDGF
jgi:hypothetical protein